MRSWSPPHTPLLTELREIPAEEKRRLEGERSAVSCVCCCPLIILGLLGLVAWVGESGVRAFVAGLPHGALDNCVAPGLLVLTVFLLARAADAAKCLVTGRQPGAPPSYRRSLCVRLVAWLLGAAVAGSLVGLLVWFQSRAGH